MIQSKCGQSIDLVGYMDIDFNDMTDRLTERILADGWVALEQYVIEQEEEWSDDVFLTILQEVEGRAEVYGAHELGNFITAIEDDEIMAYYHIRRPLYVFLPKSTIDIGIRVERQVHKRFDQGEPINYESEIYQPFDTSIVAGGVDIHALVQYDIACRNRKHNSLRGRKSKRYSGGIELTIMGRTDSTGQIYTKVGVPSKGYFSDFVVHTYGGADLDFIALDRDIPENELLYPQASEEEYWIPDTAVLIPIQSIEGQRTYINGFSNKKVYVKDDDTLKLVGYKSDTTPLFFIIQCTFHPEVGSKITQTLKLDASAGIDMTSGYAIKILGNGNMSAIRSKLIADESASGEYTMEVRFAMLGEGDKALDSSFGITSGDVFEANEQAFEPDTLATDIESIATHLISSSFSNAISERNQILRKVVNRFDEIKIDTIVIDGTLPDDKLYLEVEIDYIWAGNNDNELISEKVEYGPQGEIEEIVLLGDLDSLVGGV